MKVTLGRHVDGKLSREFVTEQPPTYGRVTLRPDKLNEAFRAYVSLSMPCLVEVPVDDTFSSGEVLGNDPLVNGLIERNVRAMTAGHNGIASRIHSLDVAPKLREMIAQRTIDE